MKETNNGNSVSGGAGGINNTKNYVTAENELKLTEVDQVMPALPPNGFRSNQTPMQMLNQNNNFEGMMNLQPCGEWCHFLTAEAQREIIRGILTSTQGNTVLKASNGRPGDKRFLVNSVWWRKWCDYVNFDLVEVE